MYHIIRRSFQGTIKYFCLLIFRFLPFKTEDKIFFTDVYPCSFSKDPIFIFFSNSAHTGIVGPGHVTLMGNRAVRECRAEPIG